MMNSLLSIPGRRGVLAGVALILGLAAGPAPAAAEPPAQALVRDTTDRVLERIRREPELARDRPRLFRFVDETILPHFDFERMSQRVLGRAWGKASEEQRDRFVAEFQLLLVRTYATALASYSDQVIEYLPAQARADGEEYSVRTRVVQSGSPPIPINYEMYSHAGDWKVFDVAIDGVSLVLNFRASFKSEIRRSGLDDLIERLRRLNQEKLAGSQ